MSKTSNVFARVEPELKAQAEQVLERLGISMSNAVGMFLRQVVMQRGIPFDLKVPPHPLDAGRLTKEEFDAELEKGLQDIREGRVHTIDEVESSIRQEFGI